MTLGAEAKRPAASGRMPWALLVASCLATFAVTSGGSTRAPFLLDMARDLEVGLPMIANLFGLTSVAWGITSFLAGSGSDRWGRRPFLIGGLVALALSLAGVAVSDSYLAVTAWVFVAGGCSGVFTGVSLAEISLRVADGQRGRALGWVMSGQSLTLLIGVPLAAWIGAGIGWRGVHLSVAGLTLVSALAMFLTTGSPSDETTAGALRGTRPPSLWAVLSPPVIRLLASVVAERICFGLAAVYYATFLQMTHALSLREVAAPLAVFAIGNVLGMQIGGRLGDRFPNRRRTFAIAMLASGAVALVLFGWHPGLWITVLLGSIYAFCNALARPPLMASLADVPAEVRGTVMGFNGTCASLGWLAAAAFGGWMLAIVGFAGFGPGIAILALLGAVLAVVGRN